MTPQTGATPCFALLTYQAGDSRRAGVRIGSLTYDLAAATGVANDRCLRSVIADWPNARTRVLSLLERADELVALPDLLPLSPLQEPGTIYCAGANYADHMAEMARATGMPMPKDRPERSWHFIKSGHTVVPSGARIEIPPTCSKLDWEVELAVVIGKKGKDITVDEALNHVAGYVIAIDFSARDFARRKDLPDLSPFKMDWMSHKNFDGACPVGQYLVPADLVPDPHRLNLSLAVNGEVKQDSNTAEMIFSVAEQIRDLSERITLWPGDVILTGTPAGVGSSTGTFLKPGDVVAARIQGLGELLACIA